MSAPLAPPPTAPWAEALADYELHLRRRNLAQRTREGHLSRLRLYCKTVDPVTVRLGQIESFLDTRQLCARARLDWVGTVVGFHQWLVDQGTRDDDPTAKIVRPKLPPRLPRPIRDEDLRKAFTAALGDRRMTCWLALAAYAGLRVHEIAALTWAAVDYDARVLRLTTTKGGRHRTVPMADAVRDALQAWERHLRAIDAVVARGPVFPAMVGGTKFTAKPISRITATTTISRFLRDCGIPATAHQLRHWFATETYRRTRDIRLIGDLLGHTDLKTTALYVKLVPSKEAIDAVRSLTVPDAPAAS